MKHVFLIGVTSLALIGPAACTRDSDQIGVYELS